MERLEEEVTQAVVIADNFNDNFAPLTDNLSSALLPLVNVPLLDYTLESLNRSGIEEVFVFACNHTEQIKQHIKNGIEMKSTWSVSMTVQVIGSEGCRCLGDALRDLDAKGLIRGNFILMGADTVSNAQLIPILEEHKKNTKYDKGAAMTVVFKKISAGLRTIDEVVIATERDTNRLLFHQRIKPHQKERNFDFPLEMFLLHSNVMIQHDVGDPQIAICGPSVLPLFADNFDFETRDDFIRGLLINEEILASTIYVSVLPREQYAAKVSNWQTYQIVSNDIINRWAFPLVPDMGICCLKQNYVFLRRNIYKNKDVHLARGGLLREMVVIHEKCSVDDESVLSSCVVGKNCKIGKNCEITNSYIMNDCIIEDSCILNHCVIGSNVKISKNVKITEGAVIGENVIIPENTIIVKDLVQSTEPEFVDKFTKLGEKAFKIPDAEAEVDDDDSSDDECNAPIGLTRLAPIELDCASSVYSESSDEADSRQGSPIPEDANIFLSEVIDSLTRGFEEKSNPDFLILEINSSRYAYNMSLEEVNYYVVKAILNLPTIRVEGANIIAALSKILNHLGPVMKNYIRGDSAMRDCLKAVEECCNQDEIFKSKLAQIIHYLYDKEILTEEAILSWNEELDEESEWVKASISKLIAWLEESSDDETSEEEE